MSQKSSCTHVYSAFYRRLHWPLAFIIITLLIAGQKFNFDLSEANRIFGLKAHSTLGTLALIFAVTLFVKRFVLRRPTPTPKLPLMKMVIARTVQISLYALAIFVPVSGGICALYSAYPVNLFSLFDLASIQVSSEVSFAYFRTIHVWATRVVMILLVFHAGAALYHHFIIKDKVLKSMATLDPLLFRIWQRVSNKKNQA